MLHSLQRLCHGWVDLSLMTRLSTLPEGRNMMAEAFPISVSTRGKELTQLHVLLRFKASRYRSLCSFTVISFWTMVSLKSRR